MKVISTLRVFLLVIVLGIFTHKSFGQTPTDGDYRTIASGNWSGAATWQVRALGMWASTAVPPILPANVYIQSGHTLTIDVATASCNDIHINSLGVLAIGVNTLEVSGKLRAYTGVPDIALGADGSFYTGQTSTTAVGTTSISSTGGSGEMKFVGNTRTVTIAGEWGNDPQAWDAEFAPTAGQTLTIQTGFKAQNITVASGTVVSTSTDLRPDGGVAGSGTLTVKNGSALQFSNASIDINRDGAPGATSHFGTLTVEAGAVLEFSGASSPVIGASVFALNGTVVYSGAGSQTLAAKGANSGGADPDTYTNLTVSNSGIKSTVALFTTTVNGTFSLQGTASLAAAGTFGYGAAGILEYRGSAAQTTGASPSEWPLVNPPLSLTVNNSNGVTLNATGGRTIGGALTLTNGILTTSATSVLTMGASSTIPTIPTNASFVDGPISKIGNTAFTFPVGKTNCGPTGLVYGYAALDISNFIGGAVTDQFTAEYKRGDALALGTISNVGIDHVSRCDYWILTRDLGASTVDIRLSWANSINNCIVSPSYINDLPTLTIAHNNNIALSTWDNFAAVGAYSGGILNGQISWTGTQSGTFGAFALASVSFLTNPLPINLNYLNGFKQNGNHNLTWKVTCTNNPSATMSLERSANGRNFAGITTITADALRCQQPFDYTDNSPLAGINYYRLKMTDAYGKITYTNAIALLNKESGFDIVGLSPTLVSTNAVLNVTAAQKTKMNVLITDIAGKQVQKIAYNLIAGSNQFTLNLSGLSAGTYQITGYTTDGKSRTVRFVKQ